MLFSYFINVESSKPSLANDVSAYKTITSLALVNMPLHTCSASKVIHGYGLHRLDASSYQGCRNQTDSAAWNSLPPALGYVTTICHWTPSSRKTTMNAVWRRCGSCYFWHRDIQVSWLTYLQYNAPIMQNVVYTD